MEKFLKELFTNQSYDSSNFFLIAGPCVVESEELLAEVAEKVSAICKNLGIPYIFKSSYRKANRTSGNSFTGLGNDVAMKMHQNTGVTGGTPQLVGTIAKAAVAAGADGIFIETHPDPSKALSDGANMLKLDLLERLLEQLVQLRKVVSKFKV